MPCFVSSAVAAAPLALPPLTFGEDDLPYPVGAENDGEEVRYDGKVFSQPICLQRQRTALLMESGVGLAAKIKKPISVLQVRPLLRCAQGWQFS
jgi:hypothetical protein